MNETTGRSILVTGASSGIGWATSLDLAAGGWRVFAAVRKEADADRLREGSSGRITAIIMDVVDYESVGRGVKEVEELLGGAGLDALFNNAGISVQGPMEIIPIEMFESQMRVNVYGSLFVSQAFLPLLRRARGRIVFMSSESGRITLPLVGPYSASKFALEAVANALRVELRRFGVKVSLVEAATVKTPMWEKIDTTTEKLFSCLSPEAKDLYMEELDTLRFFPRRQAELGIPMEKVVRVIGRVLEDPRPKARYLVGWEARALVYTYSILPTRLVDLVAGRLVRSLGKWM
ncbi:MAG: SDR family oxidoreductase [Actinobacteria bacterium]|nr:SDR family oxidoreductase [Actinomycetota bacterium]MBU2687148.1 SDR family oxidoreductase [Actinomycetota bacterium]